MEERRVGAWTAVAPPRTRLVMTRAVREPKGGDSRRCEGRGGLVEGEAEDGGDDDDLRDGLCHCGGGDVDALPEERGCEQGGQGHARERSRGRRR